MLSNNSILSLQCQIWVPTDVLYCFFSSTIAQTVSPVMPGKYEGLTGPQYHLKGPGPKYNLPPPSVLKVTELFIITRNL